MNSFYLTSDYSYSYVFLSVCLSVCCVIFIYLCDTQSVDIHMLKSLYVCIYCKLYLPLCYPKPQHSHVYVSRCQYCKLYLHVRCLHCRTSTSKGRNHYRCILLWCKRGRFRVWIQSACGRHRYCQIWSNSKVLKLVSNYSEFIKN